MKSKPYHIIASSHVYEFNVLRFHFAWRHSKHMRYSVSPLSHLPCSFFSLVSRSFWLKFKVHITVSVNTPIASLRVYYGTFFMPFPFHSLPYDALVFSFRQFFFSLLFSFGCGVKWNTSSHEHFYLLGIYRLMAPFVRQKCVYVFFFGEPLKCKAFII